MFILYRKWLPPASEAKSESWRGSWVAFCMTKDVQTQSSVFHTAPSTTQSLLDPDIPASRRPFIHHLALLTYLPTAKRYENRKGVRFSLIPALILSLSKGFQGRNWRTMQMSKERLETIETCKRFQGRNWRIMQMSKERLGTTETCERFQGRNWRIMQMSKERLGTIEDEIEGLCKWVKKD